ncbi:biotin--[acetyl-CoA-carboxylase] ligase [Arthrospiribacter ruber]|uniref:Biotin--[acetyl-CoA-carboxylase] ligase n=1 Tax=Arthrospiribacter ruber TaxID=2487934 RepID=A0A951ITY1_9BACT|nr:biotin--[acetyl-CoA-carboxylase] ligase [Arthrospiribacter ruber]MBW3467083.1 biotin--[acetyl-CoA-carboxylase] ligase [Arthrospiribacter ruber]
MYKILANTVFLGKDVRYLTECHSTNDLAMDEIRKKSLNEGCIIITDSQTKGKGQRGSQWWSESGKNLTFSLVLKPVFLKPSQQFYLSKMVSVAIHEVLSAYSKLFFIKWPNDILHFLEGKTCGILIENVINQNNIEYSVVGIGLNVNQTSFPFPNVSSLAIVAGTEMRLQDVLEKIVGKIEYWYRVLKSGDYSKIDGKYKSELYQLDRWAYYDDGEVFKGRIKDTSPDGKLIMEKESGEIKSYGLKEVRFL